MRKLIGIADTCSEEMVSVGINYSNYVIRAGHLPVIIPYTEDAAVLRETLSRLDGLLLPGGGSDVDPARFGQPKMPWCGPIVPHRDDFEFLLLDIAVSLRLPVLGICRGIQVINVYFGGTLYQDLEKEWSGGFQSGGTATESVEVNLISHQRPDKLWEGVHDIEILPGSHLHALLGSDRLSVNSTHHQAIRAVAPSFVCTAQSPDGVIEAIESTQYPILAVQFHPERLVGVGERLFG